MPQRIVYLSWPAGEITGGIKMACRHAEALRAAGLDAALATADARAPAWFPTSAPVLPLSDLGQGGDILVFPENHHDLLQSFASWPNPKVIFCQNQFMLWRGLGRHLSYTVFGIRALICPGLTAAAFCRRRCPDLPVHLVPYPLDTSTFAPAADKRLQIAYMPRKRPFEAQVIRDLCRVDPRLTGVPWVEIAGMSEAEVARVLAESAVFLSLCRLECLPLSALEALASGCVVAGFTGLGGRDYATAQNGLWAEEDDCLGCAEQLGRAVALAGEGGPLYRHLVAQAIATAANFSYARFSEALLAFWRRFLDEAVGGSVPPAATHAPTTSR